jgi:hypothetical protein
VVRVGHEIEPIVDDAITVVVDAVAGLRLWIPRLRVAFVPAAVGGTD